MKNILYLLLIFETFVIMGAGQPSREVDLSILANTAKIEVLAYEKTGIRTIAIFQKVSEIETILEVLKNKNLSVDPAGFNLLPPSNAARFKNSSDKTIFIIWFGKTWIGSQNESTSSGTEKWKLNQSQMSAIRNLFKIKEL